jgi:hypothetical protein
MQAEAEMQQRFPIHPENHISGFPDYWLSALQERQISL